VIVCFNFCGYAVAFVEFDDAGVVFEDAESPRRVDFSRGFCDVRFEEAADFLVADAYFAFERLVAAVLRPCLAYGLELHISWVSLFTAEVSLDFFEFLGAKA
jgi:hypothetical protein